MSLLSLCRSAGVDVAVSRNDAGACAGERKTEKNTRQDSLVVRYSALQEAKLSDFPKISQGVSDHSSLTLQDELGIMRLQDRQTVTFRLKKRGGRGGEGKEKEAEKEKIQKRTKEEERERYVALVRSRVMEFITEMINDVKSERIKDQTSDRGVAAAARVPHRRPHTVDTPGARMKTANTNARPRTNSGTHPNRKFDDRLTDEDKKALKAMLGEILKRKLREGGWSQGSPMSRQLSNVTKNSSTSSKRQRGRHHGAFTLMTNSTPTSKSRESSSVTMTRESRVSMTSSRRHKRPHTRDSARRSSRAATPKQNGIGQFAEKSLQLLRERVRESAVRVIRERQKNDIDAGDRIVLNGDNENQMRVIFNHKNSRSHPQLYGLRNTSKNSTADWVMRQDFEQFKDEEGRDVTTTQNDVTRAAK